MAATREILGALAAVLLCGAGEPPPPPPELASYIKDGRFEPGDYGWMRGYFADATPQQRELFLSAMNWSRDCRVAATEAAKAELAAIGIPDAALPFGSASFPECRQATMLPFDAGKTFAEFEAALSEVRPIAATYVAAARQAQSIAMNNAGGKLGDNLAAQTMVEQMLRFASGGWGREQLAGAPALGSEAQAILRGLIGLATIESDHANTEWLKAQVAQGGWPKISVVGEKGANAAWLLAQHADLDPVFQAQALRMMEPLAAQGEVSQRNYAYLYDRIMLKLAGKQRYGTQWNACEAGKRALRPLEDEARLAELRRGAGLDTIEESGRSMDRLYGPCPEG